MNILLTNLMVVQLGHRHSMLFLLECCLPVDMAVTLQSHKLRVGFVHVDCKWKSMISPFQILFSLPAICFLLLGPHFLINTTTHSDQLHQKSVGISTVSFLLCPTSNVMTPSSSFPFQSVSHLSPSFPFQGFYPKPEWS